MELKTNVLYYGDNLEILRKYIPDGSVDLIYLDPPFNSQKSYNILFKESDRWSEAQIKAFEDTWHWTEATEKTYLDIVQKGPSKVAALIDALHTAIGENDVMAYLVMMAIRLVELHRVLKDTGSLYLHCDPTASHYLKLVLDQIFGPKSFRNEIVWYYQTGGASKIHYSRKHDTIFWYSKTDKYVFNGDAIKIPRTQKAMERARNPKGARISIDDAYKNPDDVFIIQQMNPMAKERLGYPTQKPEALLERIVKASSNEGDVVLDPFCGCGTAVVAAHKLNRRWIGIDITHLAIAVMRNRLETSFPGIQFQVVGEPEDVGGARALARQDRYQFQWWALSLVKAQPLGEKKKGADKGIDGIIRFLDDAGRQARRAVVQVKSGAVHVKDIRELKAVAAHDALGIFITLEPPTREMMAEAVGAGFYHSPLYDRDYPKIQLLTIEELLQGKAVDMPPPSPPFARAPRVSRPEGEQLPLGRA